MKIELPKEAEYIISALNAAGFRADIVGGSVRDTLLCRPVGDYDVTTNARPEEVKRVFADCHTVDTGIKHGTVSVILNGEQFEVTTYRVDGEYKDNRHPESVSFSESLAEDLARRDFTVNAMCYNPKDGLTDLYLGKEHLERRLICAVGDAEKRFDEDALRILRALRFASVLGFDIETLTAAAVKKKKALLKNVSKERIYVEWKKLVAGENAYKIISEYKEVICEIIPRLRGLKLPERERFLKASAEARVLSVFALSAEKPAEAFLEAYSELRTDKAVREIGHTALESYSASTENVRDALMLLHKVGKDAALLITELRYVLGLAEHRERVTLEAAISSNAPYRVSDLCIGGRELLSLGFSGKKIGETLEGLLLAVIEGRVENEREALLNFLS